MALKRVVWLHGPIADEVADRTVRAAVGENAYCPTVFAGQITFAHMEKLGVLVARTGATRLQLGAAIDVLDRSAMFTGQSLLAIRTLRDPPPPQWLAGISATVTAIEALYPEVEKAKRRAVLLLTCRVLRALGLPDDELVSQLYKNAP